MKKFQKALAILLTLCLLTGAFSMLPISAAEGNEYLTYELYDYMTKLKDRCDNGTAIVNDTPWSLQVRSYAEGNQADLFPSTWTSAFDAIVRDSDYIYNYSSGAAWVKYPGFSFYYPTSYNGVDRLYVNIATPTNSLGYFGWRANVSYAFTAPQDGLYQMQKANQDLVQSFDWANNFSSYDSGANLDFGVRVTVDDTTIWPTDEMSYYSDGWAVFGKGSLSKVEKVEVPTISNLALHEGQVLRVEFTNFTPTDSPWLQRILGSFAVKHSGDYPQEQEVPTQSQLPIRYEAYDYLTAVATNSAVNSPWNVQVNLNSSGWNNVDASYSATDGYSYLHWSGYEWGGNWPGINSYQPANYSELDRYYLAFVTASNIYGNVADTAYAFTAPFTGNYHIGKADQLKVLSFDETNYFKFRTSNAPENAKCGVRITVDGQTVWPTADDEYYDDGYACFGPSADLPDAIEIPELDVFMTSNSVLRVEYSQRVPGINDVTMPWDIETTGIVSATLTAIEGIAAPVSREIETLGLYDSADDVAITTSYVLGSGTSVANSNTATLTNDGVHLSFKAFSQGLSLSLNGFEFKLDGSNTMLVAGEENYPITIAEADDGIYNLTYNVQPAFSANEIIGTNVSLTVNGVLYEHMFAGALPSIGRNNTIVIENNSDDDITIMPGDLQIVSGSGFKVIGTVLYVGETTSIDAVKAGIVSKTKYVFIDENVATGKYFMRDGLDDVFYSLAVKGDVNGDGFVNVTDLVRFKKGLSGNVELSDAQKVAANFGNTELSDAQALINIRKNLLGL